MAITQYLNYGLWGNTVQTYLIALGIFVVSVAILRLFKYFLLKRLKHVAKKTKTDVDDLVIEMLDSINWGFYILISLYFALKWISLPAGFDKWMNYGLMIVLAFYIVRALLRVVDFGKEKLIRKKADDNESVIRFLSNLIKGVLWLVALLIVLSNIGVNITALVAGLGVGGIAIAFALQNILEDLFSSVSIYFDKPFKPGDFIILPGGEYLGIVKKIGMKTTRLESLWGEQLIVSNRELTSTKIRNYQRMRKRRIHFTFGVIYQTPVKKIKKIPAMIEEIFKRIKMVDLDRVHFKKFGDSSLNFEVAYYIDSKEYNDYMDKQQEINIEIMEKFEKEKIEFAYPTQTIFMEK